MISVGRRTYYCNYKAKNIPNIILISKFITKEKKINAIKKNLIITPLSIPPPQAISEVDKSTYS